MKALEKAALAVCAAGEFDGESRPCDEPCDLCLREARAALEAVRTPTAEMQAVGEAPHINDLVEASQRPPLIWRAMMDKILREET